MHISIEKLAEGVHHIDLNGDLDALDLPREEAVFATPVKVQGTITVSEYNLILQVNLSTVADLECSRCLTPIKVDISGPVAVLYEKTDREIPEKEKLTEADDMEVLDYDAKSVDFSHRIEELIRLNMPLKPLCDEGCKGLCPLCGINLNEATCTCKSEEVDPRWHILKALLKEE